MADGKGAKGERLGDISFGSNTADFFRDEIEFPFFRHYLKGAEDPKLPKAYVFETGKNIWQRRDQWPPSDAAPHRFYFHAHRELTEDMPAETSGFDEYVSDPNNPVPFFRETDP